MAKQERSGNSEPWKYGPYRVVVTRRVTEEEQISVECYEPTVQDAITTYGEVMLSMREAMIEYNERVVSAYKDQLYKIERQIENRGEEIRELDREWEAKVARRVEAENGLSPNNTVSDT